MRRTLLILSLIALGAPALAVGKVTTDPNAPGAPKLEEVVTIDTRLARKTTYSATQKTVSAILEDLTNSTGIIFKAGRNNKDWQVRDRKMIIFATDVPLSQLMNSISRVMKFKWEKSGKAGEWTYRLYMDRKTLLDAEAQRVREEEKVEAEQAKKRADGFTQYAKLGNLSDADKAKLKSDNPFMYVIATSGSGMGNSMGSFFREVPMAADAIVSGQRLDMNGSSLSPAAQASLLRSMQDMKSLVARFGGGKTSSSLPDDLASNMDKVSIKLNRTLEMAKGMPGAGYLLGDMTVEYQGQQTIIPFIDPNSAMAKMIGKAMIQSEEENRPMNDVMNEHQSEFIATMTNEMKAAVGGEPLNEHPDDPALKDKITLKPESQKLADVEKALAEASKLAVVSDSFGGIFGMPAGQVPTTQSELKDILDKIGDAFVYNWDKHAAVIELRDRNWFKKRAAQIPEEWLQRWRKELTGTGTLEIDSLAQIAQLTQEQLIANVASDEVLRTSSLLGTIFANRDLLRLYGSLTSDQRAALMSPSGMDLAMLSQDQFAQASNLIQTTVGPDLLNSGKPIAIVCERKASDKPAADRTAADKIVGYTFSLMVDGENLGKKCQLSTPQYYPPAKVEKPTKPADAAKPVDGSKPAPVAPQSVPGTK